MSACLCAKGLFHGFLARAYDVERIQHRDDVGELVIDGVAVAAERVQGGHLDPGAELLPAPAQPVGVDLPGPPGHQVQQPGPDADLPVRSSAAGSGRPSRSTPWALCPGRGPWCHMCSLTPARPRSGTGPGPRPAPAAGGGSCPTGCASPPEPAGHRLDRGGFALDHADRPLRRPGGQLGRAGARSWVSPNTPTSRAGSKRHRRTSQINCTGAPTARRPAPPRESEEPAIQAEKRGIPSADMVESRQPLCA